MDARLSLLNLAPNRRHAETQRFAPEWGRLTGPSYECPTCTGNGQPENWTAFDPDQVQCMDSRLLVQVDCSWSFVPGAKGTVVPSRSEIAGFCCCRSIPARTNSVVSLSIGPSGSIREANLREMAKESRDRVLDRIAQNLFARGVSLRQCCAAHSRSGTSPADVQSAIS
jgi:hypothetical protein